MTAPLLAIRDLRVTFSADEGEVNAVAGVSLSVTNGNSSRSTAALSRSPLAKVQLRTDTRRSMVTVCIIVCDSTNAS
mgnify:CR=1 FL=1